jgi:hypothetical protein
MDITTMASWFDILQDKNGSSYFTNVEKSLFINRAQIEFVNELLPDDSESPNLEISQDVLAKLSPLIYELSYLTMNSSGVITKAAVTAALVALNADAVLWRPLAIGWISGKNKLPVKYMRHNDRWEFEVNYFKRPSMRNPKVRETYNQYIFAPVNVSSRIYFTLLKYPAEVDITNTVSSDLPDNTHDRIIAIALEFAGVGSRDTMMTQLLQLKQQQ